MIECPGECGHRTSVQWHTCPIKERDEDYQLCRCCEECEKNCLKIRDTDNYNGTY